MGETAQQPAAVKTRQPIPGVASLRVNPERIERMWQMTAQQRVEAAQQGRFTLGEMLRWASRRPSEPASPSGTSRCRRPTSECTSRPSPT